MDLAFLGEQEQLEPSSQAQYISGCRDGKAKHCPRGWERFEPILDVKCNPLQLITTKDLHFHALWHRLGSFSLHWDFQTSFGTNEIKNRKISSFSVKLCVPIGLIYVYIKAASIFIGPCLDQTISRWRYQAVKKDKPFWSGYWLVKNLKRKMSPFGWTSYIFYCLENISSIMNIVMHWTLDNPLSQIQ